MGSRASSGDRTVLSKFRLWVAVPHLGSFAFAQARTQSAQTRRCRHIRVCAPWVSRCFPITPRADLRWLPLLACQAQLLPPGAHSLSLPICPQCLSDLRSPRQSWKVSRNLGPCFSTWVHITIILGTFEQYQGLNPMPGDDLIDLQPSWISRISKVLQVMLMLRTTRPVEGLVNFDSEKAPRDMNGISYCFLI